MSLHPALEQSRDALLTRRGLREKFGHHVTARAQHEPLQAAYQYVGESFWSRIFL